MYCKHCGKQIDEDSFYCRFCGLPQIEMDNNTAPIRSNPLHTELGGEIRIKLGPNSSMLKKINTFIAKHSAFFVISGIWFVINCILLASGGDRDGFWPHTYSHRERVAEHTRLEYIPWTGETVDAKYWDLGPEQIKINWDLDYYGFSEFLIYAILVPFIIFLIYNILSQRVKNKL